MILGRRIRRLRKAAGISLADLVELAAERHLGIELDAAGLRSIEREERPAPRDVAVAVARALGADLRDLEGGGEYVSETSQALLRLVEELGRAPLQPQTIAQLMESLGEPRDRVMRALRNLEHAEWAEQGPGGWRLAPRIVRLSERMRLAIADVHRVYLA